MGLYSFIVEQSSRPLLTIMITVINWYNHTSLLSMCQEGALLAKMSKNAIVFNRMEIIWTAILSGSRNSLP